MTSLAKKDCRSFRVNFSCCNLARKKTHGGDSNHHPSISPPPCFFLTPHHPLPGEWADHLPVFHPFLLPITFSLPILSWAPLRCRQLARHGTDEAVRAVDVWTQGYGALWAPYDFLHDTSFCAQGFLRRAPHLPRDVMVLGFLSDPPDKTWEVQLQSTQC